MEKFKKFFINLIFPAIIIPAFVGTIVGIVVFFYKYLWDMIFIQGVTIYDRIINTPALMIIAFLVLMVFAYIQTVVIKYVPESRGGGIPTSEGIVRGSLSANPYVTSISCVILSYMSVFAGVSLGSEGPSVLLGTTVSNMFYKLLPKSRRAYKRYIMTSGASTAFAVATGAPITGILFSLEEIHKKFSPMIILVSISAVVCGSLVDAGLSNVFHIDLKMFGNLDIPQMTLSKSYLFLIIGVLVGLAAFIYSKLIELFKYLIDDKLTNINIYFKILFAFVISFLIGFLLKDTLGGGHNLILKLYDTDFSLKILILYFLSKLLLVSYTSQSNVTGGLFIPTLTIGAIVGAIITKAFHLEEYRMLIISISMASFMGSSIGCPLSAIIFSIEALGCVNNILLVSISVFVSYATFILFKGNNIYDIVLERKLKNKYNYKDFLLIETNILVANDAFVIGKQTRDLLLPPNMKILYIQRCNKDHLKMDNKGEKVIEPFDTIVIQAQSYDIDKTKQELESFFGEQENFTYNTIQDMKY